MTFGPWQFDILSLIGLVIISAYQASKGIERAGVTQVVPLIAVSVSLILALMTMGVVVANVRGDNRLYVRRVIERVGPPIYMLFFALVGARLQLRLLPAMGMLRVVYLVLRASGKPGGAWLGSHVGGVELQVRRYLGLGLLSQAGVAIGLALSIADRFDAYGQQRGLLGTTEISAITATTFAARILGPISLKFAISQAGGAWQRHLARGKTQSWVERAALMTAA